LGVSRGGQKPEGLHYADLVHHALPDDDWPAHRRSGQGDAAPEAHQPVHAVQFRAFAPAGGRAGVPLPAQPPGVCRGGDFDRHRPVRRHGGGLDGLRQRQRGTGAGDRGAQPAGQHRHDPDLDADPGGRVRAD